MKRGIVLLIVCVIIVIATGIGFIYLNQGNKILDLNYKIDKKSPIPAEKSQSHYIKHRKNTSPNDTTNWIFFSSELYKYSLKYPNNFKIIIGNKNIFQANSKDYVEENGVVTKGAITQVIASDTSDSFEQAWGEIDKSLKNLGIEILSKENAELESQPAYKFRLAHEDGTTEVRYLTYKSPFSYKISIVIGKNSQAQMDDYEQILDDITSTFNF